MRAAFRVVLLWTVCAGIANAAENPIRTLVPKIVEAWSTLDISKVDPYYAKDTNLAFFDIAPMKYSNWAEYRTTVQKLFFEPNQSIQFTINPDLQTHRQGKLAWVTFTFGADLVSKQGARSHVDGRWTMILEQRGAHWVVVHEHVSVPMAGG